MASSPTSEKKRGRFASWLQQRAMDERAMARLYSHEEGQRWRRSGWWLIFFGVSTVAIDLWGFMRAGGPPSLVPHLLLMLAMGLLIGSGITSILTGRWWDIVIDLREGKSPLLPPTRESDSKDP